MVRPHPILAITPAITVTRALAARLAPWRAALYDFDAPTALRALHALSREDTVFRLSHPIGEHVGAQCFFEQAYAPLAAAWPDLERRDTIVISGPDQDGHNWVGCAGYYTGVSIFPWLDIPATGHQMAMRFHEFYRFEDEELVEVQALWDIVEVMHQARAWPLAPSLGREWHVPGPATQDGIARAPYDPALSQASQQIVLDMLEHLGRHPQQGGPELMQLERFWHPRMNWYGPSGIGTGRGIEGFRRWHQIPFLKAMPDRGVSKNGAHFFADGAYVAVTGWPNMALTLSHDGWLGIAPAGQPLSMRSLDFWRVEHGLIRENWVLIDLLDIYAQLGVDVFARLRELTGQ